MSLVSSTTVAHAATLIDSGHGKVRAGMATIKTEITALIGRCRRVGWPVELQDNGHYKVKFDDGSVYLIHQSYSDRNAVHRVLRHLEKMGLSAKEEAIEEQTEADKATRLAAERATADATGRKLAKQARLSTKAAGPYGGPEQVPLDWFLAEHPAPWPRLVIINPPLAVALLERNIDNRPWRQSTVDYYASLMLSGRYHLTHQGMAIDTRGILQDGQQRLMACRDSGVEISTAFFVGMPRENFKAIDEGRNRSLADLLGKDEIKSADLAAGTMRLIAATREPMPRAFMRGKVPNEYLYDAFKGDPVNLQKAVLWGKRASVEAKVVGSALCAAAYLLYDANGWNNCFVQAFLNGLVTGAKGDSRVMLDVDDPRWLLRKEMEKRRDQGNRMRAIDQLGFVLLAWNLVVDRGEAGKKIKWAEGRDDIPQVTICRDRGRGASAAPDKLRGEFVERT